MLKVGITGGIGSGKTLVSTVFKHLGVPVYNSDTESKKLVNTDAHLQKELVKAFGDRIYKQKEIDREYFAHLIFNDNDMLGKANSIIHTYVRKDFNNWLLKQFDKKYIIDEAAILFESGAYQMLDKIIVVYAPEKLRISRVMERSNVTKESVLRRMKNQLSDEEKVKRADFVIYNDERQMVLPQILELHKHFIEKK